MFICICFSNCLKNICIYFLGTLSCNASDTESPEQTPFTAPFKQPRPEGSAVAKIPSTLATRMLLINSQSMRVGRQLQPDGGQ
jgi:hypothetical protein